MGLVAGSQQQRMFFKPKWGLFEPERLYCIIGPTTCQRQNPYMKPSCVRGISICAIVRFDHCNLVSINSLGSMTAVGWCSDPELAMFFFLLWLMMLMCSETGNQPFQCSMVFLYIVPFHLPGVGKCPFLGILNITKTHIGVYIPF